MAKTLPAFNYTTPTMIILTTGLSVKPKSVGPSQFTTTTIKPTVKIIIAGVIDKAKGLFILRRIIVVVIGIVINVVFGIGISVVVVVVVVVNCEGPTLSCLTLSPVVRMIIVGVIDEAKGSIIV